MCLLDVLGQAHLVGIFDLLELLAEVLVFGEVLQLVKESQVLQEIVTSELARDEL